MCGFASREAVGCNPRLTQGVGTDASVAADIGRNLARRRACKALMINYRSGCESQPFWVMFTINPVVHQGKILLYVAILQDYTDQLSQMKILQPTQFYRSTEMHQRECRLEAMTIGRLAKPTVYEVDASAKLSLPIWSPVEAFVKVRY